MTKWILNRFSPWAGESLRLVLLDKLHTVTYAILVKREPGGVMSFLLWKIGWLVAFQEDSTMSVDCRKS